MEKANILVLFELPENSELMSMGAITTTLGLTAEYNKSNGALVHLGLKRTRHHFQVSPYWEMSFDRTTGKTEFRTRMLDADLKLLKKEIPSIRKASVHENGDPKVISMSHVDYVKLKLTYS